MDTIISAVIAFVKTILSTAAVISLGHTGEEAPPPAAITPEEARAEMHEILVEVEDRRSGAEVPSAELAAAFRRAAWRLEDIQADLEAVEARPGDESYREAGDAARAGAGATNCLANLVLWALADPLPEISENDLRKYVDRAKREYIYACAYAAPEIAAKISGPQYSPSARQLDVTG